MDWDYIPKTMNITQKNRETLALAVTQKIKTVQIPDLIALYALIKAEFISQVHIKFNH